MAAGERSGEGPEPAIERFLGDPTRKLTDWRWLWDGDRRFPIRSHRGVLGRLIVAAKRLLRPLVSSPQADLWERQRIFNLVLLEYLQRGDEVRHVVLDSHEPRFAHLEALWREGLGEVMEHNDALFARADQKLDRVRRETQELWGGLRSALAVAEGGGAPALAAALAARPDGGLDGRGRGTADELAARLALYVEALRGRGEVLELGCGNGEALAALRVAGVPARGVDGSAARVAACRERGLAAEAGDPLAALERAAPASLGGVVALHVVEHLAGETIDRLVRLARRALAPGGRLVLESPHPLSVVVAARNFWSDPTRRRPVHPAALELLCRDAGFDPVERLELQPFAATERLPEIELDRLPEATRPLAHEVNRLRDELDELLFGAQVYALIATRP